jgi:hypothetical protein
MNQYDNRKLWVLVSDEAGKDYVSVAAPVPETWNLEIDGKGRITYVSGQYTIRRGLGTRRSYTVLRQGVELSLSLTGSLAVAKARAVKNAHGLDRMHVA